MKDIINIIKDGNLVIPMYLLRNYKKFDLKMDEFIFLMYLYNIGNKSIFDTSKYSNDLDINNKDILKLVSVLVDKDYLKIDSIKNDKNVREEVINLDGFYNKISIFMIDKKESNDSNIFSDIEKEFGRTLSSIEYEIVKAWLDNNISEELIRLALKEAIYNGVFNLRYIDKILYEWSKKGIKNSKDVEKAKKKFKDKNKDIDLELVDWNWFDEE